MSARELKTEDLIKMIQDVAYVDGFKPVQDWEIIATDLQTLPEILRIIEEGKTKNAKALLICLYLFIGDCRESPDLLKESRPEIDTILTKCKRSPVPAIHVGRYGVRNCSKNRRCSFMKNGAGDGIASREQI
jgi:hypothetical protein